MSRDSASHHLPVSFSVGLRRRASGQRVQLNWVLRAQGQTTHRGRAKAPKTVRPPTTHFASAARQVWCWNLTNLPATVMGRWFNLYLILEWSSRKIVGCEVHDDDHSDHAVHLVRRAVAAGCFGKPDAWLRALGLRDSVPCCTALPAIFGARRE